MELMVALLLGSTLSLAIAKVYLEGVRNYVAEEEIARIQENGRFSLGLLKRELMLVGLHGGALSRADMPSGSVSSDCVGAGNWALDVSEPLDFINDVAPSGQHSLLSVNGTTLTCLTAADIEPGTDVVAIKRTAGSYTLRNGLYQGAARAKTNQWYLRTVDYGAEKQWFYQRLGGFPQGDMGADTQVDYWEYYARIFYIRKYSQAATDNIPTLCVEALGGGMSLGKMTTQCLVEGVEDMQIEFGVDTDFDNTADQFKDAPNKAELANAVVARIYLLMRSVAEVPGQASPRTYRLGKKEVRTTDGYVRRVMSATVQMPNLGVAVG